MMKCLTALVLAMCFLCVATTGCSGASDIDVDVDMTVMSSTMAQAEFIKILSNLEDYVGKTIKAAGPYYSFSLEQTGFLYRYIMIVEGDECCRIGLEIRSCDEDMSPDELARQYALVEVVGVLKTHMDFGYTIPYVEFYELSVS